MGRSLGTHKNWKKEGQDLREKVKKTKKNGQGKTREIAGGEKIQGRGKKSASK